MLAQLSSLNHDRNGGVLVLAALAIPVLAGALAFMMEVGYWYTTRLQMQNAADMAALGAASLASDGLPESFIEAAVSHDAALHGFDPQDEGTAVETTLSSEEVEVGISRKLNGIFTSLFRDGGIEVSVISAATWVGDTTCVIALDTSAGTGIRVDNIGSISTPSCDIHSNSPSNASGSTWSPLGSIVLDSGHIEAATIHTAGELAQSNSGANTVSGEVIENSVAVSDPFAGVAEPTYLNCDKSGSYTSWTPVLHLSPGTYCDGLQVMNAPRIVFSPGVYVIKNGDMEINNAVLEGSDVTFFLADGGFRFQNYSGTSDLSAPTSGPLAGILLFQSRSIPGPVPDSYFRGGSRINFDGAIYMPDGHLEIDNNAELTLSGDAGAALVVGTLEVRGGAELSIPDAGQGSTTAGIGNGLKRRLLR